jgi:hypothetical protein
MRLLRNDLLIPTLCLLVGIGGLVHTQEKITLGTPETTLTNTYEPMLLTIVSDDPLSKDNDEGMIRIELRGTNGEMVFCHYSSKTNPTATTLSVGLNKANMSTAYANNATTGSLRQRILHRLAVMGESAQVCNKTITGTVTGTPQ